MNEIYFNDCKKSEIEQFGVPVGLSQWWQQIKKKVYGKEVENSYI